MKFKNGSNRDSGKDDLSSGSSWKVEQRLWAEEVFPWMPLKTLGRNSAYKYAQVLNGEGEKRARFVE